MFDTLLHEILHAVYFVWNLEDKDDEERTVTGLSTGLSTVLHDNPELVELLSSSLSD